MCNEHIARGTDIRMATDDDLHGRGTNNSFSVHTRSPRRKSVLHIFERTNPVSSRILVSPHNKWPLHYYLGLNQMVFVRESAISLAKTTRELRRERKNGSEEQFNPSTKIKNDSSSCVEEKETKKGHTIEIKARCTQLRLEIREGSETSSALGTEFCGNILADKEMTTAANTTPFADRHSVGGRELAEGDYRHDALKVESAKIDLHPEAQKSGVLLQQLKVATEAVRNGKNGKEGIAIDTESETESESGAENEMQVWKSDEISSTHNSETDSTVEMVSSIEYDDDMYPDDEISLYSSGASSVETAVRSNFKPLEHVETVEGRLGYVI